MKAKQLDDTFLDCRISHQWVRLQDAADIPELKRGMRWGATIWHRCGNCGMYRYVRINSLGRIGTRGYLPPAGYSLPRDEVPTKAELRLELVRRTQGLTPSRIKSKPVTKPKKATAKRPARKKEKT